MEMAAVSATIGRAALGSGAARQTAATQVWISIGGHSECSLRDSRTVPCRSPVLSTADRPLSSEAALIHRGHLHRNIERNTQESSSTSDASKACPRVCIKDTVHDLPKSLGKPISTMQLIKTTAVALSLSAAFGGQPAYAEVTPNVLAEVGVRTEVAVDSAPSVEAILAKQLARRFREMTDEELVDVLQQLLKASGSSLSSQTGVDDGIRPKDLAIQNEKKQIDKKSAERTIEEKVPATQELAVKSRKEAKEKNMVSETQRANIQGLESRERNSGGLTLPQATNNGQADERETQKLSETANDQQQQGKDLSMEKGKEGNISSDARLLETQERLRGGNLASTVPPTAENNAEDMSESSKSNSSDTGVKSAADENVKEGSREDEDLTGLLWAEWSQRIGGQIVEEPQPSSTSFNFAEFGQDVIKKVAEFTALQRAIGVFTIWSFFMFLAYRLGRVRASSRKGIPGSKKAPNRDFPIVSSDTRARGDMKRAAATLSQGFDFIRDNANARIAGIKEFVSQDERVVDSTKRIENYEAGVSPEDGQSIVETDLPENGKWWRTPLEDDLLSKTKQTSASNRGNNQLSGRFVPGDSRQDLDYLSQALKNGTNSDSPSSVGSRPDPNDLISSETKGSRPDPNDPISSETKQVQGHHGREETSRGRNTPLYPSWISLNSVDSKSTELQAAGYQPRERGSQRPFQADWRNREVRDAGEQMDQEEVRISDSRDISTMSKSAIIDSWKGKNRDHRRATPPTGYLHSAGKTGTGWMTSSGHMTIKPLKPVDGDWVKRSRKYDPYEQVKQKDSLEGVSAKPEARELEDSVASQSDGKLNTFVHDHALWVRDDDGIFIRQAATIEGISENHSGRMMVGE